MSGRAVRQRGWSVRVKALLSLGLLAGLGAVATSAAWTGTATATSTISAATVGIGVGANGTSTGASYTIPITATNWFPGMSQAALVTVKNTSSVSVPYTVQGSAPGTLGTAAAVGVSPGGSVSNGSATTGTCSVASVYSKTAGQAFPAPYSLGVLASGGTAVYCVQAQLPLGAAPALQGESTTITLTFTATAGS